MDTKNHKAQPSWLNTYLIKMSDKHPPQEFHPLRAGKVELKDMQIFYYIKVCLENYILKYVDMAQVELLKAS